MTVDPWADISIPSATAILSARRAAANHRWDFFWARDHHGKCLLLLQHADASRPARKLPTLKGLDVELWDPGTGRSSLALRLRDNSQKAIFLKLSEDIIESAESEATELTAVSAALARTWRWHHLLKGGPDSKLTDEEQKGLLGELLIFQRHLMPLLSPWDAVASWTGPLDAPKDFEIGRVAIEGKARRGAATPYIKISSEHQLDTAGCACLLLHVVELARLPADSDADALSLPIVINAIRKTMEASDPAAVEVFDGKLASVGYRVEDGYEQDLWVEGGSRLFEIADGFPSITARSAGLGVRSVQYSVELMACEPYAVPMTRIRQVLEQNVDDPKH